jgi:preprotein translocase subunit SecG
MQSGNTSEITAISGSNPNSYLGKNKTEDRASRLKKWTYILGAGMLVLSILYFVLQLIGRQ